MDDSSILFVFLPFRHGAVLVMPNGIFPVVRGSVFFYYQFFVYIYAMTGLLRECRKTIRKDEILLIF